MPSAGTPPRVLVVGDAMLDRYLHTDRIPGTIPERFRLRRCDERAGGAANVAANAAALGARVTLVAATGADQHGQRLRGLLAAGGVQAELAACSAIPTTLKTRLVVCGSSVSRIDHEAHLPDTAAAALRTRFERNLGAADVVVLSDYVKGVLDDLAGYVACCRAAGVTVLVDSKRPAPEVRGADLLTPNLAEVRALLGWPIEPPAVARHGAALLARVGAAAVLATLGAHGLLLLRPGHAPLPIPARGRCVDPTGAGDTVIAALAVALAGGADLASAAYAAQLAAAVAVSGFGTVTASRDAVEAYRQADDGVRGAWGS